MSIKPKVAIVTVYYNRRDHVVESVKSLLNQTYDNLEIIIIDDCSTDDTFVLLQETVAGSGSKRVKLKRNEHNKGFTQTLIDTIKDIDAEYIAIHGAGDISLPTRVEEQVKHLENNIDVGVVTTDITNLTKPKFHKTEITLKDLLKKNRITHGAVMFRKDSYEEVGGYRNFFKTRQDKDLWFRMTLITKINYINKKLYEPVEIKQSVSKGSTSNMLPTYLSVFAKQLIKERIRSGQDVLDKFGNNGSLFFKTKKSNILFLKLFTAELKSLNFKRAYSYLRFLVLNNINEIIFILIILLLLLISYD